MNVIIKLLINQYFSNIDDRLFLYRIFENSKMDPILIEDLFMFIKKKEEKEQEDIC